MIRNYVWFNPRPETDLTDPQSVHYALRYGTLEEFRELREKLGLAQLQATFLNAPQKIYTPSSYQFTKHYLLKIDQLADERAYLTTTPRHSRSR